MGSGPVRVQSRVVIALMQTPAFFFCFDARDYAGKAIKVIPGNYL
jgi:hypothetical protein